MIRDFFNLLKSTNFVSEFKFFLRSIFRMFVDIKNNKKIIVFDLSDSQFQDFLDPIIFKLLNKKYESLISIYFVYNLDLNNKYYLKYKSKKKKFFHIFFLRLIFFVDIFITPHFYSKCSFFTKAINVSRGVGKWNVAPKKYFKNFKIHFLTNQLHLEQVKNSIKIYNIKKENVRLFKIGFPKLDEVLVKKIDKKKFLKKISLNPENKTIIFSPSWDKGLCLSDFKFTIVKMILENYKNFNVIIKLHPSSLVKKDHKDYSMLTQGINWNNEFSKLNLYKNIYFAKESNANDFLQVSDIMITDVSSIAWEFLAFRKPIIYYDSPNFYKYVAPIFYKEYGLISKKNFNLRNNIRINCGRNYGYVFKNLDQLKLILNLFLEDKLQLNLRKINLNRINFYNKYKSSNVSEKVILRDILKLSIV
jgi:CDP-glycerol glycerophosphotransferase (TagB/SpsB family)